MAQYLPFIPDVLPEPVIYEGDFNFFDKMLQKKQLQYEQGVSKLKYAYQSVHDAPLSDKANIPLRDQYLKQAQDGLKKLAASDLSLTQNQQAANELYSPFWEDKLMMQDYALTKWYQSEAQKLSSWKDSNDPKVREQYNGIVSQYLMNGLDVLKNANRDPNAYAKVEKREALPWTNIESYLETAANAQKLAVKYDDPSGPYLVSTENGERSKVKYATWAQSMIGNNFYQQFHVTGVVEKEQRIKNIKNDPLFKSRYPNATNQDVLNFMSDDVIGELKAGYTKRNEEVDVELARVNSLIKSLPSNLSEQDQLTFNALVKERSQLLAKKDGINQEYKNFDKDDESKIKTSLLTDPDSYFSVLAKQRLINNWSTGRASMESKTVKPNTAWSDAENIQLRRQELQLNTQKAEWDRDQDLWERAHPKTDGSSSTTKKDKDGNPIPEEPGVDQTTLGVYQGLGTTDITKNNTGVAYSIFRKGQDDLYYGAHDMAFDTKGILSIAKKDLGLNQEEITLVSSALKKEFRDNDYKFTKEEAAAANKLTAKLEANAAVKEAGIKVKGPNTFRDALFTYTRDYFNQRLEKSKDGNDIPLSNDEFGALISYAIAVKNLEMYNANEANRKQLIKDHILNNKDYSNLVVTRKNGEKDLITLDDLAKDMPTLELQPYGSTNFNNVVKLDKKQVAAMYMKGELSQTSLGDIFVGGVKYSIIKTNDQEGGVDGPRAWNDIYNNKLTPKYGSSEEFKNKLQSANEEVVPNLLYFQQQSGKMGQEWYYNFDKKKNGDKAVLFFNNALAPANATIYDDNGKQVSTEDAEALRALLQNKEENMEKYIQGFTYKTIGTNGKPTIRFNIGEISAETKQQIGGVNLDVLNQKAYNLAIDETTQTNLRDLPQNTGNYIYGAMLRGETIKSDPIIAASGFDFELVPSEKGLNANPSSVHLTLNYRRRVNKKDESGKLITTVEPVVIEQDFNLRGADNIKTPDEIVNYMYELYYNSLLQNRNAQQEYQKSLQTGVTGQVVKTKEQMLKEAGLDPSKF